MAQTPGLTAHRIWQWYERGVERHRMAGLYEKTEQAHRFFAGDQWAGVESGGELLPKYNFIQSIVEYKVAGVASNTPNCAGTWLKTPASRGSVTSSFTLGIAGPSRWIPATSIWPMNR